MSEEWPGWGKGETRKTRESATCQVPGSQQVPSQRETLGLGGHDPVQSAGHCPFPW